MRATVIKAFRDKEHMEVTYYEGDSFEGVAERVHELERGGYVVADKPKPAPRKRAAKPKE